MCCISGDLDGFVHDLQYENAQLRALLTSSHFSAHSCDEPPHFNTQSDGDSEVVTAPRSGESSISATASVDLAAMHQELEQLQKQV